MKQSDGEIIVTEAARLMRGLPPSGLGANPKLIADLLCHHQLGPLGSWRTGKHDAWRRYLMGDAQKKLDETVLPAKIRRHMVSIALADAMTVLHDVHPLLFKGMVLAELYPRPYLRDPGDMDVLVPREEFDRAEEALQDAGWRLQPSVHRDRPRKVAERYGFAQVYRHPVRPVILDLHRAPVDRTEPFWIDPDVLYDQTTRVRFPEGVVVSSFSPEIHLALIALHSVRHGTFRLTWSFDVHLACKKWRHEIDPGRFEDFCRRWHILRAVRTGLEVARQIFNTEWHPLEHLPLDMKTVRAAARRSPWVVARGHVTRRGGWRRFSAMTDLMDNRARSIRYIYRTLFPERVLFQTQDSQPPGWGQYAAGRISAILRAVLPFRSM